MRQDILLDLVGDMGDDLHGPPEIVSPPFLGDHRIVDLAGGEVVAPAQAGGGEPLVMAEVQVGLRPVIQDKDLAVLERVHGSGIDVDVGVQLLQGDGEAPGFQQGPDRGSGQTFPQRGEHASGDKDKFRPSGRILGFFHRHGKSSFRLIKQSAGSVGPLRIARPAARSKSSRYLSARPLGRNVRGVAPAGTGWLAFPCEQPPAEWLSAPAGCGRGIPAESSTVRTRPRGCLSPRSPPRPEYPGPRARR